MKMIAVLLVAGVLADHRRQGSNPSSSGMHTSTSRMAMSVFRRCANASRAELALIRSLPSSLKITS